MSSGPENQVPWNEKAALEELERLKRGIEEWRQRRKDVQADFDRFVRGFKTPPLEREVVEAPDWHSARESDFSPPEMPAGDGTDLTPPPSKSVASPEVIDSDLAIFPVESAPTSIEPSSPSVAMPAQGPALPAEPRRRRTQVIVATGGLAVVVAVGALLTRPWGGKAGKSPDAGARPAAARATAVPGPNAPPNHGSSPAVPDAPRSEITALRRVWVRVTVDGVREVERELQAGDRIPLRTGQTVVIRAGNAGAVRLTLNGEDQGPLGSEGQVVTRTLQPSPTSKR
jgi:hypothetical protein